MNPPQMQRYTLKSDIGLFIPCSIQETNSGAIWRYSDKSILDSISFRDIGQSTESQIFTRGILVDDDSLVLSESYLQAYRKKIPMGLLDPQKVGKDNLRRFVAFIRESEQVHLFPTSQSVNGFMAGSTELTFSRISPHDLTDGTSRYNLAVPMNLEYKEIPRY